jgi:UDP-sulfoquinovose synthase
VRILILGGDGYLGWPTAMHLANEGHEIKVIDNYLRRNIARETCSEPLMTNPNLNERAKIYKSYSDQDIAVQIGDCTNFETLAHAVRDFAPDTVIHYAEQPSAPYSMLGHSEANTTFQNNLGSTFNLVWAILQHAPDCHIIKLGTMGEYGTPNIDIEEGWLEVEHNGRKQEFLYPRQAGSLYHTTKILDTDLLWFYARTYNLRVTDLMQGPVYGLATTETNLHSSLLPNFHYDDIFGTVVNRFLVQAVAGVPLTVYGKGEQTRGYLNLKDTLQCVTLAADNPVARGELRILNQFTEQFSVNEIAKIIRDVGNKLELNVEVQSIKNPRIESEEHYYNAKHRGLSELGLKPHKMTDDIVAEMLEQIIPYKSLIDTSKILPRSDWN